MLHAICIALLLTCCGRPQGFTVKKIEPRSPSSWNNSGDLVVAQNILRDRFYYLGSGSHTYAFANDMYVIKFFKQKRLNKDKEFNSCKLALEKIPEESGLLYIHLCPSLELGTTTFIDQHGKSFTLDMNKQEFIIQRRAVVGFAALEKFLQEGNEAAAFEAITNLFAIIRNRAHQNLYDRDLQLFKNFGFIKTQPIEIDIGNLREDETAHTRLLDQFFNVEGQLRRWIQEKHPHLEEKLEALIKKEHRIA